MQKLNKSWIYVSPQDFKETHIISDIIVELSQKSQATQRISDEYWASASPFYIFCMLCFFFCFFFPFMPGAVKTEIMHISWVPLLCCEIVQPGGGGQTFPPLHLSLRPSGFCRGTSHVSWRPCWCCCPLPAGQCGSAVSGCHGDRFQCSPAC